jgi:hypothetical protein
MAPENADCVRTVQTLADGDAIIAAVERSRGEAQAISDEN